MTSAPATSRLERGLALGERQPLDTRAGLVRVRELQRPRRAASGSRTTRSGAPTARAARRRADRARARPRTRAARHRDADQRARQAEPERDVRERRDLARVAGFEQVAVAERPEEARVVDRAGDVAIPHRHVRYAPGRPRACAARATAAPGAGGASSTVDALGAPGGARAAQHRREASSSRSAPSRSIASGSRSVRRERAPSARPRRGLDRDDPPARRRTCRARRPGTVAAIRSWRPAGLPTTRAIARTRRPAAVSGAARLLDVVDGLVGAHRLELADVAQRLAVADEHAPPPSSHRRSARSRAASRGRGK